jgi:hypothetical protein
MVENIILLSTIVIISCNLIYSFLTREEVNPDDPLYTKIYNFIFSHIIVIEKHNDDNDEAMYVFGDSESDLE